MTDEVVGKQLELLKETLPKISRVAAMWNPANPVFQKLQLRVVEATARALNVKLQKVEARDPDETRGRSMSSPIQFLCHTADKSRTLR